MFSGAGAGSLSFWNMVVPLVFFLSSTGSCCVSVVAFAAVASLLLDCVFLVFFFVFSCCVVFCFCFSRDLHCVYACFFATGSCFSCALPCGFELLVVVA